ncbi:GDSL-type esterase/lipase family protein [Pseudoalteromonas denitrificans]|jgi:lysophospholipase L1-like esterase|uniref:Lysophospholipase L1 n=1 Tax=Pseudoalteromonas denitrificans DSM 6059 TaxID=1123010 RepID=A0A1I1KK83_9GAMM|nr:GDSL-type esterase/lipase family protein [Pseudoalteromonas denitrificans]SFC61179.1 Lysophospholipase L1 [Pseudoalteromonas denitrificans DSM 6059]
MIRIVYILLVFLQLACSEVSLKPLSDSSTIVAFGDSLTYGKGVPKEDSYPSVLAQLTHLKVINTGISGETTGKGLMRFETVIHKYNPQLIILLEGGNDFLRNKPKVQTQNNLAKMIEMAQARDIEIILVAVPQKSIFLTPSIIYQELAQKYNLVLLEDIITDLLKNNQYKSDQIHFNKLGYQKLAQRIYQELKDKGAID